MSKNRKYITTLNEYIDFIEELPLDFSLSRGQNQDFELLPGALRKSKGNNLYSKKEIDKYLDEFKKSAYNFSDILVDIKDELEWMVFAQHYGLPTRLLDFTKSFILSLMFAVEKAFEETDKKDGVVYFLSPEKLNLKNAQRTKLEKKEELECIEGPVVIELRKINKRIQAQNGVFVYFNSDDNKLESIEDEKILRKIYIKSENKKDILVSLFKLGIGFSNLYPELNYLSKDILMKKIIADYLREE